MLFSQVWLICTTNVREKIYNYNKQRQRELYKEAPFKINIEETPCFLYVMAVLFVNLVKPDNESKGAHLTLVWIKRE